MCAGATALPVKARLGGAPRRLAPRAAYEHESLGGDLKAVLARPLLSKEEEQRYGTLVRRLAAADAAREALEADSDIPASDDQVAAAIGVANAEALQALTKEE